MRSGKLRKRLLLRSPVQVQVGDRVETVWQDVGMLWGRIEPLSGREIQNSIQPQASNMLRVTIRYRNDLTTKSVFVIDGRELGIVDINDEDERHKQLVCTCYEVLR